MVLAHARTSDVDHDCGAPGFINLMVSKQVALWSTTLSVPPNFISITAVNCAADTLVCRLCQFVDQLAELRIECLQKSGMPRTMSCSYLQVYKLEITVQIKCALISTE